MWASLCILCLFATMNKQAARINVASNRKCVTRRWAVITSYSESQEKSHHPFHDAYSQFKLLHSSSGHSSKFVAYCYCAVLQAKMSVSVFHSVDCFSSSPFLISYFLPAGISMAHTDRKACARKWGQERLYRLKCGDMTRSIQNR